MHATDLPTTPIQALRAVPDAAQLRALNAHFREASPREVLRWALDRFAPYIALATGFGPSGVVLMHLVSKLRPVTTVFYLDTGLLFPETLALRDRIEEQFGLRLLPVRPDLTLEAQHRRHGPDLWARAPDRCCALRKVSPLRRLLASQQAWVAGLRRDQSPSRAEVEILEWDHAHRLVKLNPLAYWSEADVWAYIRLHELPYNPLHDRGFPSVGCRPCTRAVRPGEDRRAGRWDGHAKTECGIHVQPSSRPAA